MFEIETMHGPYMNRHSTWHGHALIRSNPVLGPSHPEPLRPQRSCALLALVSVLLGATAAAQPVQPVPTVSAPVEDLLASAPHLVITNGQITARVAVPDLERGFFRGTRFDQAGVITSLRYKGREFYRPWFEARRNPSSDFTASAVWSCMPMKMITPSPGVRISFS